MPRHYRIESLPFTKPLLTANTTIVSLGMCPTRNHDGTLRVKGGMTMATLRIVGLSALALVILAPEAMARGAASGGVRGAMVGGMVGGSSAVQNGAKVGAVVGATGAAVDRSQDRRGVDSETQSRTQYESSTAYQNAPHSDYNAAPPEVMTTSPPDQSATPGGEAIIRKDGKPIVGITFPSDWKQKAGDNSARHTTGEVRSHESI